MLVLIANAVQTANYSASSKRFVHAGEREAVKRTEAGREEDRLTFRPSEVQRRGAYIRVGTAVKNGVACRQEHKLIFRLDVIFVVKYSRQITARWG